MASQCKLLMLNTSATLCMHAQVRVEDFSSYLAKLSTPRELMIMMTEILARMEAHPDKSLEAQDMEIAVTKALEQAV